MTLLFLKNIEKLLSFQLLVCLLYAVLLVHLTGGAHFLLETRDNPLPSPEAVSGQGIVHYKNDVFWMNINKNRA